MLHTMGKRMAGGVNGERLSVGYHSTKAERCNHDDNQPTAKHKSTGNTNASIFLIIQSNVFETPCKSGAEMSFADKKSEVVPSKDDPTRKKYVILYYECFSSEVSCS